MATAYIYNGYGDYDERDGVKGTALKWAGREFFFPYKATTALPDQTIRELDHAASTPSAGYRANLEYQLILVKGNYIADQLTSTQVPNTLHSMGVQVIQGKATGQVVKSAAGFDLEGQAVVAEVTEREATKPERDAAELAAKTYKEMIVGEYFQSKRQRMNGGIGKQYPDPQTRLYMNEIGVIDNDDVTAHAKPVGGMDPEMIKLIMEEARKASEVSYSKLQEAVDSVRKAGKAQLSSNQVGRRKTSLNLAENKARYDAEQTAMAEKE